MPATPFEHSVNAWRGWCCVVVTLGAVAIVLSEPASLTFWSENAYAKISEPTGRGGLALAAFFILYLVVDTLIGIVCRHQFRRSMGAVFLHHILVGLAVAAYLLPSPPRGLFFYVIGEALTACRVLPPQLRWRARSGVFAFRRLLWLYLFARDIYFYGTTAAKYGVLPAIVPPFIAVLLLLLDAMWWREHLRSAAHASAKGHPAADDVEGGCSCGGGGGGRSGSSRDDSADEAAVGLLVEAAGSRDGEEPTRPAAGGAARGPHTPCVEGAKGSHGGPRLPSMPLRELDLEALRRDDLPDECDTP